MIIPFLALPGSCQLFEQVIEFLNWASEELAPIAMPEHISAEITRASERLIELSLARRAILTVERFRRWLPDDPA